MTSISNVSQAATTSITPTKANASARAADGDYKTKGVGHDVKDADGDYKPTATSSPNVTAATTLSALTTLKKGG